MLCEQNTIQREIGQAFNGAELVQAKLLAMMVVAAQLVTLSFKHSQLKADFTEPRAQFLSVGRKRELEI